MFEPEEIFLVAAPGLEGALCDEARAAGFAAPRAGPGGVTARGGWAEARRACLVLRGPARVLVRIASFRAQHLSQLDKRARRLPWSEILRPDQPFRVEASCRKSRIYHSGAAAQRVAGAIRAGVGAEEEAEAELRVMVRIDADLCTISLDVSGEPLHRRGFKTATAKAPMRETLAALMLRLCGYEGDEPVIDPMCGSGAFVIEAAEIAAGLNPGRARDFAFERLAGHDREAWAAERAGAPPRAPAHRLIGYDRNGGAVRAARENAARAGVGDWTDFAEQPVTALSPPEGPPGLIIVNPPYGGRIGEGKGLHGLYRSFGDVVKARFPGWRVGLVTSAPGLARAAGLPFADPGPPIDHGGIKVRLYRTDPLPQPRGA